MGEIVWGDIRENSPKCGLFGEISCGIFQRGCLDELSGWVSRYHTMQYYKFVQVY